MWKNVLLCATVAISGFSFSQEAADKKIQAGMTFGAGANINQAETKRMSADGGSMLNVGVDMHYSFSNTVGFYTGVSIDFETNKISPTGEIGESYYYYEDTDIKRFSNFSSDQTLYQWTSRTQKPVYLTIPTQLLFRTKFFGLFRYYGKFGLRSSFLVDNKINDTGFTFSDNTLNGDQVAEENRNMNISRDMNFFRGQAGFSFGAEWNFSGSISLATEAGYYFGFVPIYAQNKQDNQTTFFLDENNQRQYYSNDMSQNQFVWKMSILF